MYNFDILLQRKYTDCTKWDAIKRDFGKDGLMPFWVADADFPVFDEIHKALALRIGKNQTYGYTFAGDQYFTSLINWNWARHNLELCKEDILPVPGVVTALAIVLLATTKENDKVLINPPVYTPFFSTVKDLSRQLVLSPLINRNGHYEFDFQDMEKKFADGVKVYVMCSPHNPVGRVWTTEEVERVSQLCKKYHVLLVSDEIHCDIVYSGHKHIPILNIDPDAILLTAPSKTFNIAGLKGSTIFIKNETTRAQVDFWIQNMHLYPNLFAFQATTAAYTKGAEWVDELNAYLESNANFVVEFLSKKMPKVVTYVPESTYLMWLDLSAYGMTSKEIESVLINEANVALNPGEEYGTDFDQFVRMNIAVPKSYLQRGLEQIAAAFDKH